MSDLEFEYFTDFVLDYPVSDFEAAREYLAKEDMTKYLIGSFGHSKGMETLDPEDIISIEWKLLDNEDGKIILITTRELTDTESKAISRWISGQNSDGLGEGFEQQDFAMTRLSDNSYDYDYAYEDEDVACSSFDWETNNYELHLNS